MKNGICDVKVWLFAAGGSKKKFESLSVTRGALNILVFFCLFDVAFLTPSHNTSAAYLLHNTCDKSKMSQSNITLHKSTVVFTTPRRK